jgi:hypothetical protein
MRKGHLDRFVQSAIGELHRIGQGDFAERVSAGAAHGPGIDAAWEATIEPLPTLSPRRKSCQLKTALPLGSGPELNSPI